MAKKKHNIFFGPILVVLFMIVIIALCSWIFSLIGASGQQTTISGGKLVTTLISTNNLISKAGIKFLFSNIVVNFSLFEPLFLLIIALIGISIGEASGMFKAFFAPLRKVKLSIIIMITIMLGILGNILGPSAYALLIPLAGIIYKNVGRNPMIGIITMFIALTIGQGAGTFFNFDQYVLGRYTEIAAQVSVDQSYTFSMTSNLYIIFGSLIILVFIGHYIITRYIVPKVPRWEMTEEEKNEDEQIIVSKKALRFSQLTFIILLIVYIYLIIPGLPGSGILLATEGDNYLARLFSNDAAFTKSLSWAITLILMVCGGVYGFISKNIKSVYEYNDALEKSFKSISYALVLFFFTSQLIGILNWTNLNTIFATKLVDFLSTASMTGIPLVIVIFVSIVLMGILIPSITTKWMMASPIIIPLLMRANMAPSFGQFAFIVADGISKSMTPLFGYFILMIALLQKYNINKNTKITIFGILKIMLPTIILFIVVWLLILSGWYVVGIPLGVGTFPTL